MPCASWKKNCITLFERGSNEITVTDTGERIIEQAQRVLEEVSVDQNPTSELKTSWSGRSVWGAIFTIGPYLLPALIPALCELAPDMLLYLRKPHRPAGRHAQARRGGCGDCRRTL